MLSSSDFAHTLAGYRLTNVAVLYHLPDYPDLLQEFLWQTLDTAPHFPVVNKFLRFWETNIDGKLHTVRIAVRGVIAPAELRLVGVEYRLN